MKGCEGTAQPEGGLAVPFLLYTITPAEEAPRLIYTYAERIFLGGKKGVISKYVRTIAPQPGPFGWVMSENDMLKRLGDAMTEKTGSIIVDLKPDDSKRLWLYRIRRIHGYTYQGWTVVMLVFQALYDGFPCDDILPLKRVFPHANRPEDRRNVIATILYLNGGFAAGTWNWGKTGQVNGAMLYPEVLAYFHAPMQEIAAFARHSSS